MGLPTLTDAEREFDAELDGQAAASERAEEAQLRRGRDVRSAQLGAELLGEFTSAVRDRTVTEQRLIDDLRQYKGKYTAAELDAMKNRSQYYNRKTRSKVAAVTARLMDLLFPANALRNYSVGATPEPSIPPEIRTQIAASLQMQSEPGQQPAPIDPDVLRKAIKDYADKAAARMASRIDDQLTECKYRKAARQVIMSGCLYGTGILKGPLVQRKTRTRYVSKNGKWVAKSERFVSPFVESVPIWRLYPDMSATALQDCRYVWERHILTAAGIDDLSKRKSFKGEILRDYIDNHPDGHVSTNLTYEADLLEMGERDSLSSRDSTGRYELLERWGWLTREQLEAAGIDSGGRRVWFANVWLTPDGDVVKAVIAPLETPEWPYHLFYFDQDETSIFGNGLAILMREDIQKINAAQRALLDHAAITAGPMYEIFVNLLHPSEDPDDIRPFRTFKRTSGDPQYPAIRAINAPSSINELAQIAQMFDAEADEATNVPKFAYAGENPTNGAAATMGGLSMLMAQANIGLKDLVGNYDEVTSSFISALYHWNMKYSNDPALKGDYDVKAEGATSLVAREVRVQMLATFAATIQPEERAFVNWRKLIEQRASAAEFSDVILTDAEAQTSQKSPEAQMQAQIAKLNMALLQANVDKVEGQVQEIVAKAQLVLADTVESRIRGMYESMQAAGTAVTNPRIAPAGDEIWRSAGGRDATPQSTTAGALQGVPEQAQIPTPSDAGAGLAQGIETARIEQ